MSVQEIDHGLETARRSVTTRHKDPQAALALAESVLDDARNSPRAYVVASVGKALALRELGDLAGAEELHRVAIAHGEAHLLHDEAARARSTFVGFLSDTGRVELAIIEADLAEPHLSGPDLAELHTRRAMALERVGRVDDAVQAYSLAIAEIEPHDDDIVEARIRCNRAITLAYAGRTDDAVADLVIAERLGREHDHPLLTGAAAHNLGFVHGRRGDLVAAFEAFERARNCYELIDFPPRAQANFETDRCGLLLASGLFEEAQESAERGVRILEAVAEVVDLAEARLLLARACLAHGDAAAAAVHAATAAEQFLTAQRSGWAAIAGYVELRARVAQGVDDHLDVDTESLIEALIEHGWLTEAEEVRLFSAEMALRQGDVRRARRALRSAAASTRSGRADRRAQAWLAVAMLRELEGDRRGAFAALRAGLRVIDDHRALLGATELRAGASNHATALATFGQRIALDSGRAAHVLRWADRLRATSLARAPTRPPDDATLAAELVALRSAVAELDRARVSGQGVHTAARTVQRHELAVRNRARLVNTGSDVGSSSLEPSDLRRRLGSSCLIEYLEHDGQLHAVTVSRRRSLVHDLGAVADLAGELDTVRFAMVRLASDHGSPTARTAAAAAMNEALEALGRTLVDDITPPDGDAIVIVPTGSLHSVPWSALPTLRGRPVTVSPSGMLWLEGRRSTSAAPSSKFALVAGPDLPGGRSEVRRLRRAHPDSTILTGRNASVTATLGALGAARVAHIAAHGHFRADSPMFSSLRLHDGPLTVYDLEGLRSVPEIVVLPACDAGVADVRAGDEMIGTTSALLGLGVATVIAPIAPVSDNHTTAVMVRLHRHLADGIEPANALAEATAPCWVDDDPTGAAVATALTCFGVSRGPDVSNDG